MSRNFGTQLIKINPGYKVLDIPDLPAGLNDVRKLAFPTGSDADYFSNWHPNLDPTREEILSLYPAVCSAIVEYCKGENSNIAVLKISNQTCSFSAEQKDSFGDTLIYRVQDNGTVDAAVVNKAGKYGAVDTFGNKNSKDDTAPLIMCFLMVAAEKNEQVAYDLSYLKSLYQPPVSLYSNQENRDRAISAFYRLNDAIEYGFKEDHLVCIFSGGNPKKLNKQQVEVGSLNGTVLAGKPSILIGAKVGSQEDKELTFGSAKRMFENWVKQENRSYTEMEELLIPSFPDDYPVLPETIFFCKRYIATHEQKRPMLNFLWRGTTSYGKSTGVEMMAALLHRPLLRMTCNSTMETMDFLSAIVPNDTDAKAPDTLPSLDEINYFPANAYFKLTGKENDDITSDEVFSIYTEAIANSKADHALYKHVKSNFVKALENGYICEVQEISRIKDSGVLVGLNEFDRPGAMIPLADGSFVQRHPDAIVMYTDNVGYASCRAIDPSVIRRMDVVKDSFKLTRNQTLQRIRYNTGFEKEDLLDTLYTTYERIKEYCIENDITEGSVSVTELERWAQSVMLDGYSNLEENCIDCVVRKATSVQEEQDEIITTILASCLPSM